jgi:two-component system OmpR family response regulator
MKILVVEDDRRTGEFIVDGLVEAGHLAERIADGRDALSQVLAQSYDVLIVDRMLPGIDGLALVKALRAAGDRTPVLFLTAIGGVEDRVDGLDAGGDDYLVKPFAFSELLARTHALGRRPPAREEETVLRVGDLEMNLIRRTVSHAGQAIDMQPREFKLLEVLMRNRGRVVTRTMLLERVWDFHFDPKTSVVETHISRLRSKIDKPFKQPLIRTIRNVGYTLDAGS